MRRWFRDRGDYNQSSTIITIDYLQDHSTSYMTGLSNTGVWKTHVVGDTRKNMVQKTRPKPSSLRTSTNITTDHLTVTGPNNDLYNDKREVLLESPCTRTRPRLNEYMTDVRSQKTRIKRNITSNVVARNEVYLCEQLKELGLGVGSRLAIVLKLSKIPELEITKTPDDGTSRYTEYPDLLPPSEANNRNNIVLITEEDYNIDLAENYQSIRNKYDYNYFIENTNELVDIRTKKKQQNLVKRKKTRKKGKTITFRYSDYIQWDCVIFTEIRGIENNSLVLGIKKHSAKSIVNGNHRDLDLCLAAFGNAFNIPEKNLEIINTNYGEWGFQSYSLFNISPSILNFCYWEIDKELTDFTHGEKKTISRTDAYRELLTRNIKSGRYDGNPNLQNAEKIAAQDKKIRDSKESPEKLSDTPDLYDYNAWRCNKYIKTEDDRWAPCNTLNHETLYHCDKCGKGRKSPPLKRINLRFSLRTHVHQQLGRTPEPTIEELRESGIDPESVVEDVKIVPIKQLLEENEGGGEKKEGNVMQQYKRRAAALAAGLTQRGHGYKKTRKRKKRKRKTRRKRKKRTKKKTRIKRLQKKRRHKTRK